MKKLLLLTLALMLAVSVNAWAKSLEINQKAGDLSVGIILDKNPPVVGNNTIEITIKDAAGAVVTDAKVKVDYSMAAMPGMPAASYSADAALAGQKYTATMKPSMKGSWSVVVKITRGDKTSSVKFTVDAQ